MPKFSRFTRRWVAISALVLLARLANAPADVPPFSHMTLNEVQPIALAVDTIEQDFAIYGLTVTRVHDQASRQLTAGGIVLATADGAVTAPHAGLLRIRVMTNHDASGFYHLAVKLELRQKIPLGNTAGGFISQAVWTASQNGVMLASEPEKVDALVTELVGNFVHDYRAQNPAATP